MNGFYPTAGAALGDDGQNTGAGAQNLAPELFTNNSTFGATIVSQTGSNQSLTPALFTNSQSFFAPIIGRGTVATSPALFSNTASFPSATVSSVYALNPALFTTVNSFGATASGIAFVV